MRVQHVPVPVAVALAAAMAAILCGHQASAQLSFWLYGEFINETASTAAPPSPSAAAASDTDTASTTTAPPVETTTLSKAEEDDCREQIGKVENGVVINKMRKYDVAKILEEHGGAPGKLAATWNRDVPEFPVPAVPADSTAQPLPDTDDKTFWVYDYRRSDFKTYIRSEHGLLRQKGTKDEYVEVRGELYWTPPDFCGKARHAKYHVDPHGGFEAVVTLEYCGFGSSSARGETLWCAYPASCHSNATHHWCVA